MRKLIRISLLAAVFAVSSCGAFGDDSERYSELDRLRVLAIRSEPADLSLGETATLDALVFEPKNRDIEYEWSWCPSRADADAAFACNISEQELRAAWDDLGLTGTAPSYDLGSEPSAQFTHLLAPQLVAAACEALGLNEGAGGQAVLACLAGLQPSVKLTVRTSKGEVTAIRDLTLLLDDVEAGARNTNPESGFDVEIRKQTNAARVAAGKPLVAGQTYVVKAELDEANAQVFTPQPSPSEPEPAKHKETLVMSWFVTIGGIVAPGDDAFGGGDERTTFVDNQNEFEGLLSNGWELPLTAEGDAQLVLVVRDERGGVSWTQRSFDVGAK